MWLDLLPARLLLSVPAAFGAWAFVVLVTWVLRIRHPRLRAVLCGLAVLEVLLCFLGLPSWTFFGVGLQVTPQVVADTIRPFLGPAVVAWLVPAAGLVAMRCIRARRIRRTLDALASIYPSDPGVRAAVNRASARVGVRPSSTLFVPSDGSPFVAGFLHPVLVIPEGLWTRLDDDARDAVLLHELQHVRRLDNLRLLATGVLGDVFFFNWPLRRLLARWCAEREALADREAMDCGASPAGLARSLMAGVACRYGPARLGMAMSSGAPGSVLQRMRLVRCPPGWRGPAIKALVLIAVFPWAVSGSGGSSVNVVQYHDPSRRGRVVLGLSLATNPLTAPLVAAVTDRFLQVR